MCDLIIFIKDYRPTYGVVFRTQGLDLKNNFSRRWSGHLETDHFEQNLFILDVINLHVSFVLLM